MKFALQMCIVLITGHALALSRPVQTVIGRICERVRTPGSAVVVVAVASSLASLLQWGLGVIVGAFMAREMGKHFARRDQPVHYPLLGAAGYAGFMVWHGGLSGSAPLKVAEPKHFLVDQIGVIPITETVFGGLNIAVTLSLVVVIAASLWALMPEDADDMVGYEGPIEGAGSPALEAPAAGGLEQGRVVAALERSRGVNVALALALGAGCLMYFVGLGRAEVASASAGADAQAQAFVRGALGGLNLDTVNLIFLTLGLGLHRSPTSYVAAVADGARGCAGIILQFPFYFGILGLIKVSGLISQIAAWFVSISGPTSFPVLTFLSAGAVNLLVPSGGGQWAVQGPVMLEAVEQLGVSPHKVIMAMSYGDAWTNMLQPFWALPLLGIMGMSARDIIGYTGFVLLVTGPIIVGWLLIF